MNDISTDRREACNIGSAEIARRRRSGVAGLLTAGTLAALMLLAGTDPLLRWIVAVPLYIGIIGLVQARLRFCVAFGWAGLVNFGALGQQTSLGDQDAAAAARRRALAIAGAVALATLAITWVIVALPV